MSNAQPQYPALQSRGSITGRLSERHMEETSGPNYPECVALHHSTNSGIGASEVSAHQLP
jgi:hypothetical protein